MTETVLLGLRHPHRFWGLDPDRGKALRRRFPDIEWLDPDPGSEEEDRALERATVFFGWYLDPGRFSRAPRLRWIHSPATGVRRFLYPELVNSGVTLTCSRTAHAPFLAEQTLAWVLARYRELPRLEGARRERRWIQDELLDEAPPRTLLDSTWVLVGYGSAGREIARRARPFGARILAVKRNPGWGEEGADEVGGVEAVDGFLARADVVVNLLPHTDATRGFFDRKRIDGIRTGAFFVNVGRGTTVDESGLAEALGSGRLGGAGLDVFAREPLDPGSPLWEIPGVFLSPHVAGVAAGALWDRLLELFADNLARLREGRRLRSRVDPEAGY